MIVVVFAMSPRFRFRFRFRHAPELEGDTEHGDVDLPRTLHDTLLGREFFFIPARVAPLTPAVPLRLHAATDDVKDHADHQGADDDPAHDRGFERRRGTVGADLSEAAADDQGCEGQHAEEE